MSYAQYMIELLLQRLSEQSPLFDTVDLSGCRLSYDEHIRLFALLKNNPYVTALHYGNNPIDAVVLFYLSDYLNGNQTLRKLDIQFIETALLVELCPALFNCRLESLNLRCQAFEISELYAFSEVVQRHPTLKHLVFSLSYLRDNGVRVLCDAVHRQQKLETLNLMQTDMRVGGAKALARVLESSATMTKIVLTLNRKLKGSMAHVFKAIRQNPYRNLGRLYVNEIPLAMGDMAAFQKMMIDAHLTHLDISGVINDNDPNVNTIAQGIFQGVRASRTLQSLRVCNNKYRQNILYALADACSQSHSLLELDARHHIHDELHALEFFKRLCGAQLRMIKFNFQKLGGELCPFSAEQFAELMTHASVHGGVHFSHIAATRAHWEQAGKALQKGLIRIKRLKLRGINCHQSMNQLLQCVSPTVEEIYLEGAMLDNDDAVVLACCLPGSVTKLALPANKITNYGLDLILAACKRSNNIEYLNVSQNHLAFNDDSPLPEFIATSFTLKKLRCDVLRDFLASWGKWVVAVLVSTSLVEVRLSLYPAYTDNYLRIKMALRENEIAQNIYEKARMTKPTLSMFRRKEFGQPTLHNDIFKIRSEVISQIEFDEYMRCFILIIQKTFREQLLVEKLLHLRDENPNPHLTTVLWVLSVWFDEDGPETGFAPICEQTLDCCKRLLPAQAVLNLEVTLKHENTETQTESRAYGTGQTHRR